MALGGTYSTGTISVAADGTVVTGAGTLWSSVAEQGDWLFANGNIGIIASVDDDTQLTSTTRGRAARWSPPVMRRPNVMAPLRPGADTSEAARYRGARYTNHHLWR